MLASLTQLSTGFWAVSSICLFSLWGSWVAYCCPDSFWLGSPPCLKSSFQDGEMVLLNWLESMPIAASGPTSSLLESGIGDRMWQILGIWNSYFSFMWNQFFITSILWQSLGKRMVRNVQYGMDSWPLRHPEAHWMFSQLAIIFQLTL